MPQSAQTLQPDLLGPRPQPCHLLAVQFGQSDLTSLSFNSLICKTGVVSSDTERSQRNAEHGVSP